MAFANATIGSFYFVFWFFFFFLVLDDIALFFFFLFFFCTGHIVAFANAIIGLLFYFLCWTYSGVSKCHYRSLIFCV